MYMYIRIHIHVYEYNILGLSFGARSDRADIPMVYDQVRLALARLHVGRTQYDQLVTRSNELE